MCIYTHNIYIYREPAVNFIQHITAIELHRVGIGKNEEETKNESSLEYYIICTGYKYIYKILCYVLVGPPLPERQLQTAMTFAVRIYNILHRFTFVRVVWCMYMRIYIYIYITYILNIFFFILIITIRNP
jgi:hypothetical protein